MGNMQAMWERLGACDAKKAADEVGLLKKNDDRVVEERVSKDAHSFLKNRWWPFGPAFLNEKPLESWCLSKKMAHTPSFCVLDRGPEIVAFAFGLEKGQAMDSLLFESGPVVVFKKGFRIPPRHIEEVVRFLRAGKGNRLGIESETFTLDFKRWSIKTSHPRIRVGYDVKFTLKITDFEKYAQFVWTGDRCTPPKYKPQKYMNHASGDTKFQTLGRFWDMDSKLWIMESLLKGATRAVGGDVMSLKTATKQERWMAVNEAIEAAFSSERLDKHGLQFVSGRVNDIKFSYKMVPDGEPFEII